uniref:Copper(I)-binding protein n=1 Tax=Candidatus Kentrum sp. FW TaxID=2126338 RepID=A0A450U3Y4_9GAMM|nr:MAG: hypothetical protein BECKFW1821C_GA0114237_11494 [Candidatus Kentron sp. FW]
MRTIAISLLPILWVMGSWITAVAESNPTVSDPWIREAPPGAKAMAGYMVLDNNRDADISLVSASDPDFGTVMIHESVMDSGVMSMVHREEVRIPAKGRVSFEPGGLHLMLMQPKRSFVAGDESTVTLVFADGTKLTTRFEVRKK